MNLISLKPVELRTNPSHILSQAVTDCVSDLLYESGLTETLHSEKHYQVDDRFHIQFIQFLLPGVTHTRQHNARHIHCMRKRERQKEEGWKTTRRTGQTVNKESGRHRQTDEHNQTSDRNRQVMTNKQTDRPTQTDRANKERKRERKRERDTPPHTHTKSHRHRHITDTDTDTQTQTATNATGKDFSCNRQRLQLQQAEATETHLDLFRTFRACMSGFGESIKASACTKGCTGRCTHTHTHTRTHTRPPALHTHILTLRTQPTAVSSKSY